MPDDNGAVLEAIEKLEQATEALEDAINAHPDSELKVKLKKTLPKLREVIGTLNEQCAGANES
jgi:hypothetical protein